VSLSVTVWRLRDPSGHETSCVVSERDQRWQLVVQRGRDMLIAERHPSDDSALARANEIWQTYRELGWTEPRH
jgi:DNA polymerase IIIc chi subunit